KRWGYNPGSVYLSDQKVKVRVPRIRDVKKNQEKTLGLYKQLQNPGLINELMLARVINGISQRKYEKAAVQVPKTFGIKKSSVNKKVIRATGKRLRQLMERDLSVYDIVAIAIDGKTYGRHQIVVALGFTLQGEKIILGFVEAGTENHLICKEFLMSLIDRGLRIDNEILFVIDGAKGLRKGILQVFGNKAFIQRCQWHKRENVLKYLARPDQDKFRQKLQAAYDEKTYKKAKRRIDVLIRELRRINISAARSLEEGLEETLTLHQLEVFELVGISLKTTNCIENVNKGLSQYTGRVTNWKTSNQIHRWVASAMLEIEKGLRQAKNWEFFPTLRDMMRDANGPKRRTELKLAA
ncbi:MAG: transposase, partial [Desulfobacterales bacterium]|nr:transposase [Desulfobacterales bacterium]